MVYGQKIIVTELEEQSLNSRIYVRSLFLAVYKMVSSMTRALIAGVDLHVWQFVGIIFYFFFLKLLSLTAFFPLQFAYKTIKKALSHT